MARSLIEIVRGQQAELNRLQSLETLPRKVMLMFLGMAGVAAWSAGAATLTNAMTLVTYNPGQCYHIVCTNELFRGVELCIDETGTGWSVCSHHTNGWGYVAARGVSPAVSYLDFKDRSYTAHFKTNDFYVVFSWNPDTPTGGLEDYNGWVHLRSPDGNMQIVASAMGTDPGHRCLFFDTIDEPDDSEDSDPVDSNPDNWEWDEVNGGVRLCECLLPRDTVGAIIVPATINGLPVVSMRSGILSNYRFITSVSLPSTLREIECDVFRDCAALTTCNIPDAVTAIGTGAFMGCPLLSQIEVPYGVTIEENAFPEECQVTCRYPWSMLQEPSVATNVIPNTVSNIESQAYASDDAIETLLIPNSVTNMAYAAFDSMKKLRTVVIGNGLASCEEEVFAYCYSLTNVVIRNGCRIIGKRMFAHCGALKSISIPASVRKIEAEAFYGCTALTSVTVPICTVIADDAFPKSCRVYRIGPNVTIASEVDISSDDEYYWQQFMRLVDPGQWNRALKVNLRMENVSPEYDAVKYFSLTGISAAHYELHKDGTLDAYFDKPELTITHLSPSDKQMVVKVTPAAGSAIVGSIDVNAIVVMGSENLDDLLSDNATKYVDGGGLAVDTTDYESQGTLRIGLTDMPDTMGFFRFSFLLQ